VQINARYQLLGASSCSRWQPAFQGAGASTVHARKKFSGHKNVVFESETCDKPRKFWKDKGETRQIEQCNSIEANDDRGVCGIWLREMRDLGEVSHGPKVLGGFTSYAFLSLRGL